MRLQPPGASNTRLGDLDFRMGEPQRDVSRKGSGETLTCGPRDRGPWEIGKFPLDSGGKMCPVQGRVCLDYKHTL